MSFNAIFIISTLIIGSAGMYWLQEWTDRINRHMQLSTARPVALKAREIVFERPQPILSKAREHDTNPFEVQESQE